MKPPRFIEISLCVKINVPGHFYYVNVRNVHSIELPVVQTKTTWPEPYALSGKTRGTQWRQCDCCYAFIRCQLVEGGEGVYGV